MNLRKSILGASVAFSFVTLGFIESPSTTQAARYKSGTPSFIKGYWHTKGANSVTYHIFKTHIWFRFSGWNYVSGHKTRFPYHGYDRVKYIRPSSKPALICAYNRQTGKTAWLEFEKDSKNNIEIAHCTVFMAPKGQMLSVGKYSSLYRGVR